MIIPFRTLFSWWLPGSLGSSSRYRGVPWLEALGSAAQTSWQPGSLDVELAGGGGLEKELGCNLWSNGILMNLIEVFMGVYRHSMDGILLGLKSDLITSN